MRIQMPSVGLDVIYVVCDNWGCPRFGFDLMPSGFTNKQYISGQSWHDKIAIPIDPVQVLMKPGMLTPEEIAQLNWPSGLASTLALLAPR